MAITPAQRNAINEVVNNTNNYAFYGTKFLNGASAATAKAVEQEALEHICDADDNVNDIKVLNKIAKWDIQRYSATDLKRKIMIYTFGHRSNYREDTGNRDEVCVSSTSSFINIAKPLLPACNPVLAPTSDDLNAYHAGYQDIPQTSSGITYIGDNSQLFGKNSANSYWCETAACLHSSEFANPITYQGYFFENSHGRTGYASGDSQDNGQFFCYTPGGGPMKSNNWIIKYVKYSDWEFTADDINTNNNSVWVHQAGAGNYRVILKLYIHLFFPDGSYLRATIDRSNGADFTNVSSDMATSWIYDTYANRKATDRGLTFKNVWNNKIIGEEYRIVGGVKPSIVDYSMFWNGKASGESDRALQNNQRAYYKKNKAIIWNGETRVIGNGI